LRAAAASPTEAAVCDAVAAAVALGVPDIAQAATAANVKAASPVVAASIVAAAAAVGTGWLSWPAGAGHIMQGRSLQGQDESLAS
jgi:hypothetical protein